MKAVRPEPEKLKLRPGDVELNVTQLKLTPLFANASDKTARRLASLRVKGAVVLRHYWAGDVVCRQGEPGWTAFYIMRDVDLRRVGLVPLGVDGHGSGPESVGVPSVSIDQLLLSDSQKNRVKAEVSIAPARTVRPPEQGSFMRRAASVFVRTRQRKRIVPVDASANVAMGEDGLAVGTLREGELFGEMSCFSHTPRSATIRATEDCYMIELMRNVLEDALENDAFRAALDQLYRKRVLETHIASMPLFEHAPAEVLDELRRRAELATFEPGATIYLEGEEADAMYFVRLGTVRLARGGRDGRIVAYRSRGEWIGATGMLSARPRRSTCLAHESRPSSNDPHARPTVAGRVELVRIGRRLFEDVCAMFPDLRKLAARLVEDRAAHSTEPHASLAVENHAGSLGLLQAEKLMLIDLDKCTRCDDCVRACADTHDGVSLLRRDGPRFGSYLIPGTCRQCLDPTCLLGCPVGSIHRGPAGQIVVEDWCIGCGLCAEQCPYDAIAIEPEPGRKAHVCDQCSSLGDGPPMCVYACGQNAALRVDGRSFFTDWARRR